MRKGFFLILCLFVLQNKLFAEKTSRDTLKSYNIDEVVVTSSSKETNDLRTLPASVSILTPKVLNNRQISSIKDLSSFVPNLYMPDYGAKLTSAIYIRGIGARSSGQSIGLYVDNVPYLDKSTFDFEFSDIKSIEVLRGPQGTLYGRNAMGGIVKIHTLSPFEYQGTKGSFMYGSYGQMDIKLSHYRKLGKNTGFSVNGYYNRDNGFFKNVYTGKKADEQENFGGNAKFCWQINDALRASYSISAEYTEGGAFPYGLVDETTGKVADVNINDESSYRRMLLNNNLTFTYEKNNIMFTSNTGYQYLDDNMKMDQDFTEKSIFTLNQKQNQNAFSQEFAVKNMGRNNYKWSFGAYGFYDKLNIDAPVVFKKDGIQSILQSVFDNLKANNPRMPLLKIIDDSLAMPGNFKTPSYGFALYHQSTYNNLFVKGLSVTAGIRADYEKQDLKYTADSTKMHLSMTMPPMMPMPVDISNRYPASGVKESLSQDYWKALLKFAVKYEFSPGAFVYASAAQGYKAGGYNVQMSADIMQERMQHDVMNAFAAMLPDGTVKELQPIKERMSYKPETSWNFELGARAELVKDRLQAELTAFYMDVNDLQITKFVSSGNGRILSNAGKAESYGVELSMRGVVTNELTADLNYGYTHATFRDYNNGKEDYKGNYIPYTPGHTLSLGLSYFRMLANCWIEQVFASAQWNGAGKIYWNEGNDFSQKFYSVLNAVAGVRKGAVSLSLWGKNITDTDYAAFYFESFNNKFVQKGRPVSFGAKVSFAF